MHQPDIAPLAKRLAEENNVDWRRLRGSGDGGRVVERDVLEYLARVMAGDEALDPTPEPVPEGMTAWPEADVRAVHDDDDDVAEGTSTVEDDIFLFDDEPAGADADGAWAAPVDLDAPVPADDDVADGGVDVDVDVEADLDEDDLLVSGDSQPEPIAAPDTDAGPVVPQADPTALHPEALQPEALPERHDADGMQDVFAPRDPAGAEAAERYDPSPALFVDEALVDPSPSPAVVEEHEAPAPRWDEGPLLEDDLAPANASAEAATGPELDDAPEEPASAPVPLVPPDSGEDGEGRASAASPLAPPPASGDGVDHEPPPVAEPAGAAAAATAALPLWSHGHVWRRHVDLSALVAAQLDVAGELGRDAPVPLAAFLVRAAHKALGGQGAVALAVIDAAGARTVQVPAAADFVQALAACEQALSGPAFAGQVPSGSPAATSEEASDDALSAEVRSGGPDDRRRFDGDEQEPDLIVADLSDLGVDDAVLRLGAPVLTLGRVLIDTQSGGRRAVLALAGDGAEGPGAARRLARVADLLEAPVRVVL